MMRFTFFLLAIAAICGPAATQAVSEPPELTKGGVVMTFDDRNFDDWVNALPLFDEFGVKATFFISGRIDDSAATAIRKLREHGHAIGSHSVNHVRAVEFLKGQSAEEYLRLEIQPQIDAFQTTGISPVSFAYPMSSNNAAIDGSLLKIFRHVRTGKSIGVNERICDVDVFFVPATKISQHGCLYAKGIDFAPTRPDRTFEQIETALVRAAQNDEIIVLYAHQISESGKGNFVTPEALARVFGKANELGLQFYTFDQLP